MLGEHRGFLTCGGVIFLLRDSLIGQLVRTVPDPPEDSSPIGQLVRQFQPAIFCWDPLRAGISGPVRRQCGGFSGQCTCVFVRTWGVSWNLTSFVELDAWCGGTDFWTNMILCGPLALF